MWLKRTVDFRLVVSNMARIHATFGGSIVKSDSISKWVAGGANACMTDVAVPVFFSRVSIIIVLELFS